MSLRIKNLLPVLGTALLLVLSLSALDNPKALESKITDILADFPAQNAVENTELCSNLVELGQKGIEEVCRRLAPSGEFDDSAARFALNGLAHHVSKAGAENDRKTYVRAILKVMERTPDWEIKAFLISQLQLAGKKESAKPLRKYLHDERLCEPATRALLAIKGPDAEKALIKELEKSPPRNRIIIVKALGELRSRAATKKILEYADSEDSDLRQVTLFALANSGDPLAENVLRKYQVASSPLERAGAPLIYLLYARRLVESGRVSDGVRISRSLMKSFTEPEESHVRCSALSVIAGSLGAQALSDLILSVESSDKKLRGRALELADDIPGEAATAMWVEVLGRVDPEVQGEVITMLGRRGDPTALPSVLKALRSEEAAVRMAAIPVAGILGGEHVIQDLLPLMNSNQEEEISALKQTLLGFPADLIVPLAAGILQQTPPLGRAALIDILSERRARHHVDLVLSQTTSEEQTVRRAALRALESLVGEKDLPHVIELLLLSQDTLDIMLIQNALVAGANQIEDPELRASLLLEALANTSGERRADLLKPLSRIGGSRALRTVVAETRGEEPKVQAAAVFTLSQWPDFEAAEELIRLCRSTDNKKYRNLALSGYVRLVSDEKLSPERTLGLLKETMAIPLESQEKKIVLQGLANVKNLDSFKLAVPYLSDQELKLLAAQVLVMIALPPSKDEKGLSGMEVISGLKRAAEIVDDESGKERVHRYVEQLLAEEGFVPLFNGKDLSGWKGLVGDPVSRAKMTAEELSRAQAVADETMNAHWNVKDGILVFDGQGSSLCTSRDFADFELLVDWKIEQGGDSGIYLRGSPQVQIWDPDQWPEGSGGLYNNQKGPNKPLRPADNPVGEWNMFRIIMRGERVTVFLNDVLVVDDVVLENYWDRDRPIYSTGQIELQAHGHLLEFRNIYIREIPREVETDLAHASHILSLPNSSITR